MIHTKNNQKNSFGNTELVGRAYIKKKYKKCPNLLMKNNWAAENDLNKHT